MLHLFLINNPTSKSIVESIIKTYSIQSEDYIIFTTNPTLPLDSFSGKSSPLLLPYTHLPLHYWISVYNTITSVLPTHDAEITAYVPHLWNSSHLLLAGHPRVQSFSYIEEGMGSSKGLMNMAPHFDDPITITQKIEFLRPSLRHFAHQFLSYDGHLSNRYSHYQNHENHTSYSDQPSHHRDQPCLPSGEQPDCCDER